MATRPAPHASTAASGADQPKRSPSAPRTRPVASSTPAVQAGRGVRHRRQRPRAAAHGSRGTPSARDSSVSPQRKHRRGTATAPGAELVAIRAGTTTWPPTQARTARPAPAPTTTTPSTGQDGGQRQVGRVHRRPHDTQPGGPADAAGRGRHTGAEHPAGPPALCRRHSGGRAPTPRGAVQAGEEQPASPPARRRRPGLGSTRRARAGGRPHLPGAAQAGAEQPGG